MQARNNITLTGDKELLKAIRKLKKEAPKDLQKMLFDAAMHTRNVAIDSIQKPKAGGAAYQRRTVTHLASPPGGPPNTDRGTLVQSITVEKIEGGYDVGSREGAPHGFWLEMKEPSAGGRKWLEPAFLLGIAHLQELIRKFK